MAMLTQVFAQGLWGCMDSGCQLFSRQTGRRVGLIIHGCHHRVEIPRKLGVLIGDD